MNYKQTIADAMTRIYIHGMTTISGGNISMIDEFENIFISPSGVDKSSLRAEDIMKVNQNGEFEGLHKPSVELPFHTEIYKQRKDIKVLVHAHPKDIVALSVSRVTPDFTLSPLLKNNLDCMGIATYALPGSKELGRNIAMKFKEGANIVLLENHGVVIGAQTMGEALSLIEALEDVAKISIYKNLFKNSKIVPEIALKLEKNYEVNTYSKPQDYKEERLQIINVLDRLYKQHIINGLFGEISIRLNDTKFLITPRYIDRRSIRPEDLVVVENTISTNEPDTFTRLHQEIYQSNKDVQSVIIASPPYSMVFSAYSTPINTNIIPEGFILLRKIKNYNTSETDQMIKDIGPDVPIAHVSKNFYISVGKNLMQAYDRMEVLEFGAVSILGSMQMEQVHVINDQEIERINKGFSGW